MTSTPDNFSAAVPGGKVFLVGFMGSGKTYWGKKWAAQAGIDFYDLDMQIENQEGKTVAAIFEKRGEAFFRQLESEALRKFEHTGQAIIACGGGTPCFHDNMEWMNAHGLTVYIEASPPYILSRVKAGQHRRPLISKLNEAELLFFIEQKLKERAAFYNQAAFILPVNELNENSLSLLTNSKP